MRNNLEIVNTIIKDTIENKLSWKKDFDVIRCSTITNKNGITVELVFEINEEEFDEYSEYSITDYMIYLDVFFRKNNGKLIQIKRIKDNQIKLIELLNTINFIKKFHFIK